MDSCPLGTSRQGSTGSTGWSVVQDMELVIKNDCTSLIAAGRTAPPVNRSRPHYPQLQAFSRCALPPALSHVHLPACQQPSCRPLYLPACMITEHTAQAI
jgi:hypothetical protein